MEVLCDKSLQAERTPRQGVGMAQQVDHKQTEHTWESGLGPSEASIFMVFKVQFNCKT